MKFLAALSAILFGFSLAFGCSCVNFNETQRIENLKKIPIIFQGEVLSVSNSYSVELRNSKGRLYGKDYFVDVKFDIIRAWKGINSPEIKIRVPASSNSCSIPFEVGMKPTILASGKIPQTDYCTAATIEYNKIPEILGEGKLAGQSTENSLKKKNDSKNFLVGLWEFIGLVFS